MTRRPGTSRRPPRHARAREGFSLIEATISIIIVGGALVASLQAVGLAASMTRRAAEMDQASLLARDLMVEIIAQPYKDPVFDSGQIGPRPSEVDGTRALFNDVDDYHGWTASPPQSRNGAVLPNLEGWSRSVRVQWIDPTDMAPAASDTGIKRITVAVSRNGIPRAQLVALRTLTWSDGLEAP
jgi:type II secretory pathway pseudopilin PulG